jgi:hypothetical protein
VRSARVPTHDYAANSGGGVMVGNCEMKNLAGWSQFGLPQDLVKQREN